MRAEREMGFGNGDLGLGNGKLGAGRNEASKDKAESPTALPERPKKKRHQVTETLRLQGIEESASISIVRVLSSKFSYRFPLFFR